MPQKLGKQELLKKLDTQKILKLYLIRGIDRGIKFSEFERILRMDRYVLKNRLNQMVREGLLKHKKKGPYYLKENFLNLPMKLHVESILQSFSLNEMFPAPNVFGSEFCISFGINSTQLTEDERNKLYWIQSQILSQTHILLSEFKEKIIHREIEKTWEEFLKGKSQKERKILLENKNLIQMLSLDENLSQKIKNHSNEFAKLLKENEEQKLILEAVEKLGPAYRKACLSPSPYGTLIFYDCPPLRDLDLEKAINLELAERFPDFTSTSSLPYPKYVIFMYESAKEELTSIEESETLRKSFIEEYVRQKEEFWDEKIKKASELRIKELHVKYGIEFMEEQLLLLTRYFANHALGKWVCPPLKLPFEEDKIGLEYNKWRFKYCLDKYNYFLKQYTQMRKRKKKKEKDEFPEKRNIKEKIREEIESIKNITEEDVKKIYSFLKPMMDSMM